MKWVVLLTVVGGLGYLIWWFTPPTDVLGSHLPGWENSDRRRAMIRAEDDQEFTLFGG